MVEKERRPRKPFTPDPTRRQKVFDILIREVEQHSAGSLELFTTRRELAAQFGVSEKLITNYLREFDPELRAYRAAQMTNLAGKPRLYGPGIWNGSTYLHSDETKARIRESVMHYIEENGDPDAYRESGEVGVLSMDRKPNRVETVFANLLRRKGLFAEDIKNAVAGQVFFSDSKAQKVAYRLAGGKLKIPDFTVFGADKVIEVFGGTPWHSEKFGKKYNKPEYHWNPERLVEEYAQIGVDCFVVVPEDLKTPKSKATLMGRISEWLGSAQRSDPT